MHVQLLAIPEVLLITPDRYYDNRGYFSELWNAERMQSLGVKGEFIQDNFSKSTQTGTIRGLHFQTGENAQGKLVRCSQGEIWDVAVDLRTGSPWFGKMVAASLSAENWHQLWIPPGFAHGFSTLKPNTEVQYKVTGKYDKSAEKGIVWNDPTLAINWHVSSDQVTVSDKDADLPKFQDCDTNSWFKY